MDYMLEFRRRIKAVQGFLFREGLDALIVSEERNLRYLYGVGVGRGVVTPDSCILWVRDVYLGVHARLFERVSYSVRAYRRGSVERYFKRAEPSVVAFEDLSCTQAKALKRKLGLRRVRVVDVVERLRMVKSPYEVSLLRKSASIAKEGMRRAYDVVGEGVPELYAVAEVEAHLRRLGSERPPFESGMILAGGVRGADIHATPSMRRIPRGLVVVDLGACFRGYHSDLTRTLAVGRLTGRERKLSGAVESIRDDVVDRLQVGVKAADVAGFAEKRIRELGFRFYHALGHGVGLAIHERPSLSLKSDDVLTEGMVFTVEPGIYVPGRYGIRFEDTVHLTGRGPRILTEV